MNLGWMVVWYLEFGFNGLFSFGGYWVYLVIGDIGRGVLGSWEGRDMQVASLLFSFVYIYHDACAL